MDAAADGLNLFLFIRHIRCLDLSQLLGFFLDLSIEFCSFIIELEQLFFTVSLLGA